VPMVIGARRLLRPGRRAALAEYGSPTSITSGAGGGFALHPEGRQGLLKMPSATTKPRDLHRIGDIYGMKGDVPEKNTSLRWVWPTSARGTDVTVLAWRGCSTGPGGGGGLEKAGISRRGGWTPTLGRWTRGTILASVQKTHRAVVVEAAGGIRRARRGDRHHHHRGGLRLPGFPGGTGNRRETPPCPTPGTWSSQRHRTSGDYSRNQTGAGDLAGCCQAAEKGPSAALFASALAATYLQYVSRGLQQTALQLSLFEQPERRSSRDGLSHLDGWRFSIHFLSLRWSGTCQSK